jgi:hypothetical protein
MGSDGCSMTVEPACAVIAAITLLALGVYVRRFFLSRMVGLYFAQTAQVPFKHAKRGGVE